jgi:CheY-like chemotaxis protein
VTRVVALHDGMVLARSAGPGQGSEFEVRLPLARDPKALPPSPEATAPVPKPSARRVLVVEDNADGREALVSLLRLKGHEVFEAGGGSEALRIATDQRPEVVLLDIGLPDMDGYQVARALRSELGARVRLVALTGYGQPADQDRAREVGFEVHLVKPVDVKRILKMLEV